MQFSPPYRPPPDQGLALLYADEALLVLDKPSGLLTVPGRGADKADCLAARVQREYPEALIVHRLDMETSGLVLLARGSLMQRALSQFFEQRKVDKRYIAQVAGRLEPERGEVNLPLITDWPNRPRQMVDHAIGKPSLTRYQRLHYDALRDCSRVALEPLTGRSHQLRVHMLSLGHSMLGDSLYAPPTVFEAAPRLMLHAEWLRFPHPLNGTLVEFMSPCPF